MEWETVHNSFISEIFSWVSKGKDQNDAWVGASSIHHNSAYIIVFLSEDSEPVNDDTNIIFTHQYSLCLHFGNDITIINSLAPWRFQRNFRKVIFQLILVIGGWSISCKIVLKWMPMDLTDGKSTLVQVVAWCCQAIRHYLSQCWPRSVLPYGIIRPQWVDAMHYGIQQLLYGHVKSDMQLVTFQFCSSGL